MNLGLLRGLGLAGALSACSAGVSDAALFIEINTQTETLNWLGELAINGSTSTAEEAFWLLPEAGSGNWNYAILAPLSPTVTAGGIANTGGTLSFKSGSSLTMTLSGGDLMPSQVFEYDTKVELSKGFFDVYHSTDQSMPELTSGATATFAGSTDLTSNPFLSSIDNGIHTMDYNDDVITVTFIPEPSSIALLGLGGLALMIRRRR